LRLDRIRKLDASALLAWTKLAPGAPTVIQIEIAIGVVSGFDSNPDSNAASFVLNGRGRLA